MATGIPQRGGMVASLPLDDPFSLFTGVFIGVVGFMPLLVADIAGGMGHRTITRGIVAVALSFAFLMAVEAALWILAREVLLTVFAGMLVGFFSMWAVLALMAKRRRR